MEACKICTGNFCRRFHVRNRAATAGQLTSRQVGSTYTGATTKPFQKNGATVRKIF